MKILRWRRGDRTWFIVKLTLNTLTWINSDTLKSYLTSIVQKVFWKREEQNCSLFRASFILKVLSGCCGWVTELDAGGCRAAVRTNRLEPENLTPPDRLWQPARVSLNGASQSDLSRVLLPDLSPGSGPSWSRTTSPHPPHPAQLQDRRTRGGPGQQLPDSEGTYNLAFVSFWTPGPAAPDRRSEDRPGLVWSRGLRRLKWWFSPAGVWGPNPCPHLEERWVFWTRTFCAEIKSQMKIAKRRKRSGRCAR